MINKELQCWAIDTLKECQKNGDTEDAHGDADLVLCRVLRELGYSEIVEEYHLVDKWYA